jgi:hypothetical protein
VTFLLLLYFFELESLRIGLILVVRNIVNFACYFSLIFNGYTFLFCVEKLFHLHSLARS